MVCLVVAHAGHVSLKQFKTSGRGPLESDKRLRWASSNSKQALRCAATDIIRDG